VRILRPGVRVIFATGYDKQRTMGAMPASHTSFLAKPFAPDALAQAVRAALARDER
jgi:DNA-binding NtrC family response regulator